ncbi:glycoside hydrolase family 51 protein [Collybiopsis luxurians FD-317 M1]|uniref:non-reducing end alpha-L-arabinofuranosidase n=1 Tax=Collybiopsis luxurians FD-317 M1 TaxID=944289 RepID=A0A0D0BFJ4_9AGAR|nr:glycoside hydrolase family 51 protein [Collybiopsis luxurians FD-317 M1]
MLRTALTLALTATVAVYGATFDVTFGTAGHNVPSTLYGLMFEDINHKADGREFFDRVVTVAFMPNSFKIVHSNKSLPVNATIFPCTSAALNSWAALGRATISVVKSSSPVSTALPNALSFSVASGTTGTVGFTNAGFFGFPVTAGFIYTGSFFYRTPSPPAREVSGTFTADLRSTSGTVFTSTTVPFTTSSTWQLATFSFTASSTQTSVENLFALSVNATTVAGLTMEFTLISLFPPTFNNRANGFRLDLSEVNVSQRQNITLLSSDSPEGTASPFIKLNVAVINKSLPDLEGETPAERWAWENTVGDLVDRPGRLGTWGYVNTDGLGLFEYLQWIEDMDMQPIMAVYAGAILSSIPYRARRFSLDGESVAEDDLQPYITEAINQINFVIGDATTNPQGQMRAAMGHPDPFTLNYIEIGNEDFFSPATYTDYRWADFFNALHAEFPQLHYIATSATSGFVPTLTPAPTFWDLHIYSNPNFFINGAFNFDILPRNGLQFFQGEYACMTNNAGTDLSFPFIDGSIAEAAYMTGFDRNSDIVFAASYAPLLQHISNFQWSPDLISFSPNTVIPSTSYYVQKLFSLFKGDFYLTSTTNTASSPVQWSVTRDTASNQYFLKVVNTATSANTVVFTLSFTPGSTAGTGTILTAPSGTMNTPTNPNAAVPSNFSFTAGKTITYNAPALSLSVLTVVG